MCIERGSATDAEWEVERPQSIVDRFECGGIFMLSSTEETEYGLVSIRGSK